MKRRYKANKKPIEIITITIFSFVILFTVGFSIFSSELNIESLSAYVRLQKDIRITGISVSSTSGSAASNWQEYSFNNIESSISLPNSNSSITYNIPITNLGNVESGIMAITGLHSNLKYTLNNYTLRDVLCDDNDITQCTLGSTSTISITISYKENSYDSNNTNYVIGLDFTFGYVVDAVAKVGNEYYNTLQSAINAAPDNTETTVILLKNTSEVLTVGSAKIIVFDLKNNTISNSGNTNVFNNNGNVTITNGTITSDASTNGAFNNQGTLTMSGGRIISTGGRQAIYNNKGTVTISGNAYLSATTSERATVQNLGNSTITITGGTIISTGSYAVNNAGTLTIGIKDGSVSTTSPVLQGVDNGITSTSNYKFFDGIVKSQTNCFNNVNKINEIETGYGFIYSTETINNTTYNTAHLGISKAVTFNPSSGTVTETIRYVEVGHAIGPLPVPIRSGYEFDGWFTASGSNGTQIDENQIITDTVTYYAHWTRSTNVAQIGDVIYDTLQDAINSVPTDNTPTTINVLKDVSEQLTVSAGKNITFNLDGITLTNSDGNPIIENSGNINIYNGSLRSTANQSIINNVAGSLNISGGEFVITGTKQALYITGGTVTISGNPYFSSQTSGKPSGSNMERGTIHNVSGTLIITGGTIVSPKQHAISNESILTIGTKDGNIDSTTPVMIGAVNGVKSVGTFNFYDGIMKGKTNAYNGTINDQEVNSTITSGNETIDGKNYKTAYLEANQP